MKDSKRIIILGGTGLFGLNWAIAARSRKEDVVLGCHARAVTVAGVHAVPIDILSEASVDKIFKECRPNLVINAAGLTSVEKCEESPTDASEINTRGAENIARACNKEAVKLVHISSDHLFSGEIPLRVEDDLVEPQNMYARTKAEAEVRVMYSCPSALVIRTNFYGWGPSYRRSFSDFIIDALRRETEITLFQDVHYSPILIESAVLAINQLVALDRRGIFHVVGDDRISKFEFGMQLADEFGLRRDLIRPGNLRATPGLVRRPLDMSLSNARVRAILGRPLGGVRTDLQRLHQQEQDGFAREIQSL